MTSSPNGRQLWAVVVAAGTGTRFGQPKQIAPLAGRRVIEWSIDAVGAVADGVVVVGPDALGTAAELGVAARVDGGATRSESVRKGLAELPDAASHVLVHDAARPLVPAGVVLAVAEALSTGAEAVVPVVPVTDSLRSAGGGAVDRDGFVAVQTPQGFATETLRLAYRSGADASDDATLVEQIGIPVSQVVGAPDNFKITFPHDLAAAEVLLAARLRWGQELFDDENDG